MSSPFTKLVLPVFFMLLFSGTAIAQLDCINNPTYGDPPPASFFNTGTNGMGGTLPGGSNDLNWKMSTTGIAGPYSPAIVMSSTPPSYYLSPWPDCAWISHVADGSHAGNLDVYYKFSFTLACANACHQSFSNPGVFCLSLDFFADNSVYEIIINGVTQTIAGMPVFDPYNYVGFSQANMVSVSLCNNWQPGNNDLIVHVVSGPPYQGFLAQASVNTPPPIGDTTLASICNGGQYVFGPNTYTTAGTYVHTFTSQLGCDSTVTLILSVNPTYNTTVNDTICSSDSAFFAGTYYHTAGLYTHNGTTTLGCDSTTHLQLTVNTVTLSAVVTNTQCYGDATGIIKINAANSPPGYTYANGAGPYSPSNTFNGLAAGTYTIHTKAPSGCIKDTVLTVGQPTPVSITSIATVIPLCSGGTGTFTVTGSGGTPPYLYAIDAGTYTGAIVYTTTAGSHTLHVKDAHGCIKDSVVTMTEPAHVGATFNITNEPCHGQTLGVINVTGTGGTAPYTYALAAGPYGAGIFSGLAAGNYIIHVKDAHNCVLDTVATVTEPASLGASTTVSNPKCYGDSNGIITIVPNGGTAPFTYANNSGPFTSVNIFSGLPASVDSIHIVDNNGCRIDTVLYLPLASRMFVTDLQITDVRCAGDKSGTVQVFAVGGTPSYTFAIDQLAFSSSNQFAALYAGQHIVHVKDIKGCTIDTMADVTQPSPLTFSGITTTNAICEGDKNGTVLLTAQGGTQPYKYAADSFNFKSKNLFDGLAAGTYLFYTTDSLGCKADTLVTIGSNPAIIVSQPTITSATCYNSGDATITVNASGGMPPLRYQVDGTPEIPTSSTLFTSITAATHTITVTDSNNCKKTSTVTVLQTPALQLQMSSNGNLCEGVDDNGAVYVDVKGGTRPYRYTWSTNPLEISYQNGITGLANGKYNVMVTDAHDCMAWGEAEVQYDNCCTPYVPNAFTPNNDGKNDIFKPTYKGNMSLDKMTIFNRYGQVIFTSNNIKEGWDGTYKGVPQDIGTYYYFIEFYCGQEGLNKQIAKGDVTLIR